MRTSRRGFTLIEILTVVVIVGILAAVVVPRFLEQRDGGEDAHTANLVSVSYQDAKAFWALQDYPNFVGTAPMVSHLSEVNPEITYTALSGTSGASGANAVGIYVYNTDATPGSKADPDSIYIASLSDSGKTISILSEAGEVQKANFPAVEGATASSNSPSDGSGDGSGDGTDGDPDDGGGTTPPDDGGGTTPLAIYGGDYTTEADCSGLTSNVFAECLTKLAATAAADIEAGGGTVSKESVAAANPTLTAYNTWNYYGTMLWAASVTQDGWSVTIWWNRVLYTIYGGSGYRALTPTGDSNIRLCAYNYSNGEIVVVPPSGACSDPELVNSIAWPGTHW